jgi:hypothetical protein
MDGIVSDKGALPQPYEVDFSAISDRKIKGQDFIKTGIFQRDIHVCGMKARIGFKKHVDYINIFADCVNLFSREGFKAKSGLGISY